MDIILFIIGLLYLLCSLRYIKNYINKPTIKKFNDIKNNHTLKSCNLSIPEFTFKNIQSEYDIKFSDVDTIIKLENFKVKQYCKY